MTVLKEHKNAIDNDARLHHLANTFKLYKEKKLNFFYPENDNKNYTEEEEEILLKARISNLTPRKFTESYEEEKQKYSVKEFQEGDIKLSVIDDHNIYLNQTELSPEEIERIKTEDNKRWGKVMFSAILQSVSKLLK